MAADSVVNDPNGSNYSLGRGVDQQQLDELLTKSSQMVMSAPTAPRNIQPPSPVDINPNYGLPINVGTSSSGDPIFVSRGGAYPLALLDREFQYNRELDLAKQQARSMEVAKARKAAEETKLEFVDMSHKNWQEALNESLYSETMSRYDAYLNHFSKIDPETAADRARIASTKDFDYQFRIQRYKTLAKGMDDVLTKATDVLETLPMTTKVDGKERSGGYYSEQTRSLAAQLTVLPANGAIDLDKAYQLVNTFKRNVAAKDAADAISSNYSKQFATRMRQVAGNMSEQLFETFIKTNGEEVLKKDLPMLVESAMFNYKNDPSLVESWEPGGKYKLTEEGKRLEDMLGEFIKAGIKTEVSRQSDKIKNDEFDLLTSGLNKDGTLGMPGEGAIPTNTVTGNRVMLKAVNSQPIAASPITIVPSGIMESASGKKTAAVYCAPLGGSVVFEEPIVASFNETSLADVSQLFTGRKFDTAGEEAEYLRNGDYKPTYTRVVTGTFRPQGKSQEVSKKGISTSMKMALPVELKYRTVASDGSLSEIKTYEVQEGQTLPILAGGDERTIGMIAASKGNERLQKQLAIAQQKNVDIFAKDVAFKQTYVQPVKPVKETKAAPKSKGSVYEK